jgi:hypothetical protein
MPLWKMPDTRSMVRSPVAVVTCTTSPMPASIISARPLPSTMVLLPVARSCGSPAPGSPRTVVADLLHHIDAVHLSVEVHRAHVEEHLGHQARRYGQHARVLFQHVHDGLALRRRGSSSLGFTSG